MQADTAIGLDVAKSVFQVHGIDSEGNIILRRQLKRRYVLAFFQNLPHGSVPCQITSTRTSRARCGRPSIPGLQPGSC
jgi:transposase